MANKILLNDRNYDDMEYEPSDSEDEYTEREKSLLKKVRQRRKNSDDEKELMRFDESEESEDDKDDFVDNSDFDEENDDDIPDSRAWGKRASAYYHTDFVDQDYSTYTEKEIELAQEEEEEAKQIQLRLIKQLNEADFTLDVFADESEEQALEVSNTTEILKADFSNLTIRQRKQLFQKDSPEFAYLVQDFGKYFQESKDILDSIVEFAAQKDMKLSAIAFARLMNNVVLTYCTNISFYLLLKAKRIPVENHPVVKRLVQLKQILDQLNEKYQNVVKGQLQTLLEAINSGVDIEAALQPPKLISKKLNMMKEFDEMRQSNDIEEAEEELEYSSNEETANGLVGNLGNIVESDEEDKEGSEMEMDDENDEDAEKRRRITYEMAKNKGLTPHRKKELRNPRVKHRNKYRKALVRRKGAVRTVRKEIKRYSGEISGIKSTVKKGIKLKS